MRGISTLVASIVFLAFFASGTGAADESNCLVYVDCIICTDVDGCGWCPDSGCFPEAEMVSCNSTSSNTTSPQPQCPGQCEPGVYGYNCTEVCPGGADNPCSGHGACFDGKYGTGDCVCEDGYGHKACDVLLDPEDCEIGFTVFQACSQNCSCTEDEVYDLNGCSREFSDGSTQDGQELINAYYSYLCVEDPCQSAYQQLWGCMHECYCTPEQLSMGNCTIDSDGLTLTGSDIYDLYAEDLCVRPPCTEQWQIVEECQETCSCTDSDTAALQGCDTYNINGVTQDGNTYIQNYQILCPEQECQSAWTDVYACQPNCSCSESLLATISDCPYYYLQSDDPLTGEEYVRTYYIVCGFTEYCDARWVEIEECTKDCSCQESQFHEVSDCSREIEGTTQTGADYKVLYNDMLCTSSVPSECDVAWLSFEACVQECTCSSYDLNRVSACERYVSGRLESGAAAVRTYHDVVCIVEDPTNLCESNVDCPMNATCAPSDTGRSCVCDDGFVESGNSCVAVDPSSFSNIPHGVCAGSVCFCSESFSFYEPTGECLPVDCTDRDNCPSAFNPSQVDADGDGIGNACVL